MRADGTRVKDADTMYKLIPHFLTKRYDSMNMITVDIPLEPIKTYIKKARIDGKPISHLAVIITAYMKMVQEFPYINRFVVNRKIFQHNEFKVAMVVLRPGSDDSTISKIALEFGDDVFTVQKKINDFIESNRAENNKNNLDKAMNILLSVSGFARIAIDIVRLLDKHGLLPKSFIDTSPFHASVLISNLASIRTNHIYHHIYEFGTTSVAITMGNMREVPKMSKGEITHVRCIPLGIVMDERICSGHYFAQAFARMGKFLRNPELLESRNNEEK